MKTYFREEWLTNVKYKLWVAKTKDKTVARCTLCKLDISLSNMGSSALDDHARGKKHSEKVKSRETGIELFFQTSKSSTNTDFSSEKPATVEKKQKNTLEDLIINENTLNAKIRWILKVVISHLSFRSCIDLNKLFISMFPDFFLNWDSLHARLKSHYEAWSYKKKKHKKVKAYRKSV